MRKISGLALFILIFALLLVGCSNLTKSEGQPKEKAQISVANATAELLGEYDVYSEFIDFEDEYSQRVVFTTNTEVKDFNYIEISFKEIGDNIAFFESKILYSLAELTPEQPFVLNWLAAGTIPQRGITFLDENGDKQYFYLTTSGKDGSLMLVEFENE